MSGAGRIWGLHLGLIAVLFALQFLLPAYHHGNLARIMVLASYAVGYNILFGYTGLLSLGHALFFAAGMYGMGLGIQHGGLSPAPALVLGIGAGAVVSLALGLLALRTSGVAFMIVTLMFAQAGYLTILYFGEYTRGDEGFVIQSAQRVLWGIDLSEPSNRYFAALVLFAACLLLSLWLIRRPFGRTLIAIRENEERVRMLGYDTQAHKLGAMVISGTISAAAGAFYGLLFGYAGASFGAVPHSILPLLYVLLGGAGTILGPFMGALFMFYLIDLSSGVTTAHMLIAGVALVLLTLFAPQGIMGELRRRAFGWLP
ncbi:MULTISPECIES: branched-chain amino acid ABC transporter permease [Roseovarius]|uniref:Branched-chain amino acid ABC transporter, permease protein n=2 Tax=Roseovarius nubinhibens TaxID=314263 RepID=A3SKE1_ROSNI|nr:branched-chain amino acid ABC transporter permease [Roseovarius nubinhibens]EAP77822.1 branched-chain amino acid ABC transporter, permease protein [Roseovarius nubinhibens ISM]